MITWTGQLLTIFTFKQIEIRQIKEALRLDMANIRSDISSATSKIGLSTSEQKAVIDDGYNKLEELHKEWIKYSDVVVKVRILVHYADGEFAEEYNYISAMRDYMADALIRWSEQNKYYRELVALGRCTVEAFPLEVIELNPEE